MMPEDSPDYPWAAAGSGRRIKKIAIAVLIGLLIAVTAATGFFFWRLPDVTPLKNSNPENSALMSQRARRARDAGQRLVIRQKWVRFSAIPQMLKDAVRVSEDAGFYHHHGIDLGEIRAAIRQSWKQKKPLRGASTITQQLAKNLYLSPERSIWRKLKEFFIARRLEAALSKDRIFHLYLNLIELGPGIFGVEAASNAYFGKSVKALRLEEMVRLAAVIPKPLKAHPLQNDSWMKWRARWILDTLMRYQYISVQEHRMQVQNFK
jgi:monofunctional biosynthetic peptidoglycan transglycosylase